MEQSFDQLVEQICLKDTRYHEDAYHFVMDSLHVTQEKFAQKAHVSGEQLLEGMKSLIIDRFGPLAVNVLEHWGIKSTEDFGRIVFNMVDGGLLSKTDDDHFEVFQNAFDLKEAFNLVYRENLKTAIQEMH